MPVTDKAGYKRERSYVLDKWGVQVETCHVADVRRALGLTRGAAPNRHHPGQVQKPCPDHLWGMVEEAVRAVSSEKGASV
ncbi:hypothetical protein [Synechococcus phage Ssp-JY39]